MNESRLFVGNLSYQTMENDLQEYFSQAGVVTSVNLMLDKFTGKSRGFAFIEFSTADEANKAVEMFHSKEFQGRQLTDNIPNSPSGAVPQKPTEPAKVQPKKETVRINLPPKPTAAPTIKIPAPAPAAPSAAAAPVAVAPASAGAQAPAPPTPAPRPVAAPAAPTATGRPAPPQRRAPVMAGVSGLDKAL